MNVRLKRLQTDYEVVRHLTHHHPKIEVEGVAGNPPDRYRLVLHVRSLREKADQRIVIAKRHGIEIVLPAGYPRDAPLCRMLTPVFHPNIAPHAICIGDHWTAAESLDQMIQRIGEMLAFQSYNIKSPLNGRAAQWVEEHVERLPIDPEEFYLDLREAAPVEEPDQPLACANCGAEGTVTVSCSEGHALCPDCSARCETCGALLCLVCGTTRCPRCAPECANCGATGDVAGRCEQGHALCPDCVATCDRCSRVLCLVCGTYPCPDCAPSGVG
jgi:ubiquitin-protein ligase